MKGLRATAVNTFVGVLLLYVTYWSFSTYRQYRRLSHIKGPWLATVSPLWMFYYACQGTLYLAVEGALKRYGEPCVERRHTSVLTSVRFACADQSRYGSD